MLLFPYNRVHCSDKYKRHKYIDEEMLLNECIKKWRGNHKKQQHTQQNQEAMFGEFWGDRSSRFILHFIIQTGCWFLVPGFRCQVSEKTERKIEEFRN